MKKRAFCVLLLAGIVIFTFLSSGANSQTKDQPIILKGVTAFPKTNINNDPVPLFIEEVNKRSQGRLRIDWLGGPEVFASFDQIHALKAGTIDMILYYPFGYMKSLMPEAEAKGLSELAEWEERKSGAFELWTEIFEKRVNAKYLGRFHNNLNFQIHTNKKIEKISDFKGLTIRTMPLFNPFIKALGASPVTTPPGEIYTSLERGVVNGFMWARFSITSMGLQEVTKYTTYPGLFQIEPATMINLDRWKKIPKDLQDILMETMKEYEQIATKRALALVEQEDKVREKAGMRVIKLSPEDGEKLIKLGYDMTWELIMKDAPENGPKLRKLTSKAALKK
jgi:TRAP-type C4-dicarboxylate transport system substrate-binding protein